MRLGGFGYMFQMNAVSQEAEEATSKMYVERRLVHTLVKWSCLRVDR
jgi:hypothetical protein